MEVPPGGESKKFDLALCKGPFALCAASTCTLTKRNYPGTIFPEVVCTCPVLPGPSLADLSGAMRGSCAPPKDGVWSLYSTASSFPQKINGKWRRDVPASPHSCPAEKDGKELLPCHNVRRVDGVEVADCHCPALKVIAPNRTFATQAGLCHHKVCTEIPVGGPFPVPDKFCE